MDSSFTFPVQRTSMRCDRMARLMSLAMVVGLVATTCALHPSSSNDPQLTQCKELPKAEPLKPTVTHVPVIDLQWVGADDKIVYATTYGLFTDKGGLWRSKDGGASFEDLTPKLEGNKNETFGIMSIYAQQSNANNLLILGLGYYFWLSNDMGETLTKYEYPGGVQGVHVRDTRFNPRHDTWLLMHVKRASCKVKDKARGECPRDLMLNKDAFNANSMLKDSSSWSNLTENSKGALAGFVDFDWGANICPSGNCTDLESIPDELIVATAYARAEDYDQPWDKDVNLVASSDNFANFKTRVQCGNQLEVVGRSVYLAVANGCPNSPDQSALPASAADSITLFTSMDGGNTFARACLPAALKQEGYELVETHDGRGALVVVQFSVVTALGNTMNYASVYAAGPHHALFSLSLTNVFQSTNFMSTTTDFTRVEGLPAIYMANQVVAVPSSDGTAGSTDPVDTVDPSMMDDYMDYMDNYYDLEDMMGDALVETRITYNAGGRWQRIRVYPKNIRHTVCNGTGPEPWYLHLNGRSVIKSKDGSLPAVYSNPSAPGLVVATGNVASLGSGLDQRSPGLCTWLSRDGGVTWDDVAEGAYIYEFADWGGVLVMAKYPGHEYDTDAGLAKEIILSMDYGRCWQHVALESPLYVANIRIEPDGQRPMVLVHGMSKNVKDSQGLIYALNIKDMMNLPLCNPAKDFEKWSPPFAANGTGRRCVLGQQLELTRRKQDSACFYGSDFKYPEPVVITKCNCTKQLDMECDYGYTRVNDSCALLSSSSIPQCPVVDRGIYTVSSSGRRLVHGDVCLDTSVLIPDTDGSGKVKPSVDGGGRVSKSGGGWVGLLVTVLVLVVLGGCGWGWWRYRATDEQRDTVREVTGTAVATVGSGLRLLFDKIRSIRFRSPHYYQSGTHGEEMGYFQPLGDPGYDVEGRGNVFTLK